jgi:glycosyltransferase involved in cell wall biosynthesis
MSRRSLNNYQKKHPWLAILERRLHGAMTAIVGNSQRVLDQLRDDEKAPPDKLALIYNGIDIARFDRHLEREEKRKQLGISDDALVLVIVANLIPYKGHADLLAALARIKTKLPKDWVLLAVGRDDGLESKLKKQVRELDIAEHVRFIGQRHDVVELLRISNIGLISSHEEGFSNALLEGMAAGLPMIATDVGGNAEALIDGVTGLLVPAKDLEAMGDAILRLAGDPSLARRLGIAGRARVEQNFSLDACVNSYDAFYRQIMGLAPRHLAPPRWAETVGGAQPR